MAQNGGDKELVLGNTQLLSLFFLVLALCGVFFAMGYMIGRNSTKTAIAVDTGAAESSPSVVSSPSRQQSEPPRETAPSAAQPLADASPSPVDESGAASSGAQNDARIETRPALDTPPLPTRQESSKYEPLKYEKEPGVKIASGNPGLSMQEVGASYLQVAALPRADADSVSRTLREQNFPAIVVTSPKDGFFRVLVGPYHETSQLADAKTRLKTLGFANAFVQKQ